jgi:hypothetical protein
MSKRKATVVFIPIPVSSLDLVEQALRTASIRKSDIAEQYYSLGDIDGYQVTCAEKDKLDSVLGKVVQKGRSSSLV